MDGQKRDKEIHKRETETDNQIDREMERQIDG